MKTKVKKKSDIPQPFLGSKKNYIYYPSSPATLRKLIGSSKVKVSSVQKKILERKDIQEFNRSEEKKTLIHKFSMTIIRCKTWFLSVVTAVFLLSIWVVFFKAVLDFFGYNMIGSGNYSFLVPSIALSLISAIMGVLLTYFYFKENIGGGKT